MSKTKTKKNKTASPDKYTTVARVHRGGHLYVSAEILNKYKKMSGASHSAIFVHRDREDIHSPKVVLSWEQPHGDSRLHDLKNRSWTVFGGHKPGAHYLCEVSANSITIITKPIEAPPQVKKSRKKRKKAKLNSRGLYSSFQLQVRDSVIRRLRDTCPEIPVHMLGKEFPDMTLGDLLRAGSKR